MKSKVAINWFGIGFGVLMLVLPFAGPWWSLEVGKNAATVFISPFNFDITVVGVSIRSVLVSYILLFTKISFLISGVFAITASVFARRWWARRLMRFGVMKPFWSIVTLVILLVIGTLVVNMFLPSIVKSMVGEGDVREIDIRLPFLSGTAQSTVTAGDSSVQTTISAGFQKPFLLAVVVAVLGILTRVYQRRFKEEELIKETKASRKVQKAET